MTLIKPNYSKVAESVRDIRLILSPTLKVSAKELVSVLVENGASVNTYRQFMAATDLDRLSCIHKMGSEEGVTLYDGHKHRIYYNDAVSYLARKKWTLAHEAGHFFLGHLKVCFKEKAYMSSEKGVMMEQEANAFAKELLAPSSLILAIVATYTQSPQVYDFYLIYRYFFNFSKEASRYSADFMVQYFNNILKSFDSTYLSRYNEAFKHEINFFSQANYNLMRLLCIKEYHKEFKGRYIRPLTHVSLPLEMCLNHLVQVYDNRGEII